LSELFKDVITPQGLTDQIVHNKPRWLYRWFPIP
jgi:hypothetical protein